MRRIAQIIQSQLRAGPFLALLAASLVTTWFGLFWSVGHFKSLSDGLRFMDMQPALDSASLFEQIRSYTPGTTDFYLWWSLFDYAWPFITFTTMLFITAWLLRALQPRWQSWFAPMIAAACATVLMDWGENIGFTALVFGLPDEPSWLAQLTLLLHRGKLLFNMLFNIGFWILLAAAAIAGLRRLAVSRRA